MAKVTASSWLACPWGNTVRTGPGSQGSQGWLEDWPLPSSHQSWVVAASEEELSVEWVAAAAVQVAELRAVMAGAASRNLSSSAQSLAFHHRNPSCRGTRPEDSLAVPQRAAPEKILVRRPAGMGCTHNPTTSIPFGGTLWVGCPWAHGTGATSSSIFSNFSNLMATWFVLGN